MRAVKILEIEGLSLWIGLMILLASSGLEAQKSSSLRLLEFKYGYHFPAGDLQERFGSSSDIGGSVISVSMDKKILFGLEGIYIFGNTVKEDVLASLRAFDGGIIGIDGLPGDVILKQRGFYIGVVGGKIFTLGENKDHMTGIRLQLSGGLLQHQIRIQDNLNTIVALEKKYLNGYDRLSNGPAFHLGIGYHYQSPTNNFQFHVMGDLYGAATKSRRDIDYLTGVYLEEKRTDISTGLSIAYVVVISRKNKPEHIYY